MSIRRPFHLQQWIEDNRELLKPPIGNKNLYQEAGDFIVMVVGGPNARKDYHYNETEELFYQIKGDITVCIQEDGKRIAIPIREGEMFLLPGKVPHSPVRPADTVGLVIERKREPHHRDGLMWFSETANVKLYEEYFHLTNIEKDFFPVMRRFYASEKLRTCPQTGEIMAVDPRFL